jgi:hypothetical protein
MLINELSDLQAVSQRATIINVSTKLPATLALLSALRYADMPVLLIDCESNDGSLEHFKQLMSRYDFDLMSAPLRQHGQTLDWLFSGIASEQLLLVDSDLEIRDARIIQFFNEYIDEPTVFGCGFLNGPGWLNNAVFGVLQGALFAERPWMPLTLLKTAPVRDALAAGRSFTALRYNNEYSILPRFARNLMLRTGIRGPAPLRRNFNHSRPSLVWYDTGAQVFEYLRYEKQLYFAGLPELAHKRFVTHFFGVTRNVLNPADTHGAGNFSRVERAVRERLRTGYGEGV